MHKYAARALTLGLIPVGLLAGTLAANASTGPGNGNGQTGHATGKNAFSYTDPYFGQVKANETQHPKFDTVGAALATPDTAQEGQVLTLPWASDFTGQAGSITLTVSADGSSYSGIATYPAA